jgi:hypothetical protein
MSESHWGFEGDDLLEDIKRLNDDIDWRNEETNEKYCKILGVEELSCIGQQPDLERELKKELR